MTIRFDTVEFNIFFNGVSLWFRTSTLMDKKSVSKQARELIPYRWGVFVRDFYIKIFIPFSNCNVSSIPTSILDKEEDKKKTEALALLSCISNNNEVLFSSYNWREPLTKLFSELVDCSGATIIKKFGVGILDV